MENIGKGKMQDPVGTVALSIIQGELSEITRASQSPREVHDKTFEQLNSRLMSPFHQRKWIHLRLSDIIQRSEENILHFHKLLGKNSKKIKC